MSIAVGQRASRSLTLTAEHVRKFAMISGDHNPLHFDTAFAARTKFGRLVVQGGLTTGLVHDCRPFGARLKASNGIGCAHHAQRNAVCPSRNRLDSIQRGCGEQLSE